MDIG
jgi:hypothetical protein